METDPFLIHSYIKKDPNILKAKKLLIDGMRNYQKYTTSIRPAQPELNQSYKEILDKFNILRGSDLYFPYLGSGWGHGPFVELLDGSVKYDMINGIGPHFWGHSYLPLIEVAIDAALSDTIMQGHLQQNYETFLLCELLVKASGMDHCFLSSSGAMANENALKLVFQHRFPANRILTFEKCFMGRTLALAQITDKPAFREGLPTHLFVDYIPFYNAQDPEGSTQFALKVLHQHLSRYPQQHATMCFELIQGEGGFNVGTSSFFIALMRVLKENHIPIFIDEVQTFGRTYQLFAYQHFKLEDYVDIVSIGKLSQVCATLFRDSLKPKAGLLGQTFTSSSVALKTSHWIIQHLLSDDFFGFSGRIALLYSRFEEHFKRLEKQWPNRIQGPYGLGAMIVFTPFGGDSERVARFVQNLFQAGVISFTTGRSPTASVRFLIPAGVMTLEDVDAVMQIVEKELAQD